MQIQLFATMILASWTQPGEEQMGLPRATREVGVIYIQLGRASENPEFRAITFEIPAPPAQPKEGDEPVPLRAVRRLRPVQRSELKTAVAERENFDRWLFGERSEEEMKRHLEGILLRMVVTAVREYGLTDSQRDKLLLAGRGDIKRLLDKVEERRRFFEINRQNLLHTQEILCSLVPLSQICRDGTFGEGSFLAKTLRKVQKDLKGG